MAKIDFEKSLEELEKITDKLAEGDMPLDEAVSLFEKGIELKNRCTQRLNEIKSRINILVEKNGEYSEEDFTAHEDNQ